MRYRLLVLVVLSCVLFVAQPTSLPAQGLYLSGTLELKTAAGPNYVSAFMVSPQGYAITSYQAVEKSKASGAKLIALNGQVIDVAGFVAANRGQDLLLLALKSPDPRYAVLPLVEEGSPEPGDMLFPTPGPKSKPTVPNPVAPAEEYFPKLHRILRGDEYLAGHPGPIDLSQAGGGVETQWYWLDLPFESSLAGAPLWNEDRSRVIGMMSQGLEETKFVQTAVAAQHILALIPAGKVKPQPFSALRKHDDAFAPTEPPLEGLATSAGSLSQRGLPMAKRADLHFQRVTQLEQAIARCEREQTVEKAAIEEAKVERGKLNRQFLEIRPEGVDKVKDKDDDDKEKVVRVFTGPQETLRKQLTSQMREFEASERNSQRRLLVNTSFDTPHAQRTLERTNDELFYLADPCGLRPAAEHEAFVARLTKNIGEGGAPGGVFLARGLSRLCLRQLDEAEGDFRDAVEVDGKLESLVNAARARLCLFREQPTEANELLAKAARRSKEDPRIAVLQARVLLDKKDPAGAVRSLKQALASGGDAAEIHLILAWLALAPPEGLKANAASGLQSAEMACRLTGNNDPWALASLAVAQARLRKTEDSQRIIAWCCELCSEESQTTFEAWQHELQEKSSVHFTW